MKNTTQTDAANVAFLFSGQGSQYAGMLRPLVDEFAPARHAMERIDAVLRRLDLPTFEQIAWEGGDTLGSDVWLTQLSLLCADLILYCSLESLQIVPDCVAGHSYGEFPALVAAGAWDFATAVAATRARCRVIESCRDATRQAECSRSPRRAILSNSFAARQTGPSIWPIGTRRTRPSWEARRRPSRDSRHA